MRSARGFRMVLPAACFGGAFLVLLAAALFGEGKTCRVSETMPAADGGPDWTRWVVVPCEKPPSAARVETVLNPVDMDRNADDGGRW